MQLSDLFQVQEISTHTPLARRDSSRYWSIFFLSQFLLTRLLRGVTIYILITIPPQGFLLTRLLRGVTDGHASK